MMKFVTCATAAILLAGTLSGATAGTSHKRNVNRGMTSQDGMTTGQARSGTYTGGNAALQGNNGNSGQGSNSLGHIKGGNIGAGK
ncbi:MAG: hypothetical protein ABW006_04095 [Hyphomicrobium sp.]|jgi:hypothetical protein